ncbi:hypothetical protein HYH02_011445 [Chlamydomonas schloesseri]|uniref:Uncharacterized protein n=1 Tax=Chlamydomonas schloesseri TaxID=2026947 RepID=A0A835TAY7_9CHLO|nr:hypothetical protein HYH02_011445 [Chlamydomonas schloesseri]|eukprot:KAG2437014.1 hypothetical protein HYH02_011445 [Chlamydomonas schloesseri]
MCLDIDSAGTWWAGQWHRKNVSDTDMGEDCEFHRIKRLEIIKHFSGKKIWFSGDSLNRQLYMRTINYIRGMEGSMEHYFHDPALYTYYKNGTDKFEINVTMLPEMHKPLADNELFRISFWFLLHVPADEIVSYKPDICIIGAIHHFTWGSDWGNYTRQGVEDIVRNGSVTGYPKQFFWMMFADGDPGYPGNGPHLTNNAVQFASRARAQVVRVRPQVPNVNYQVIPFDTMSVDAPYKRNELEKEWMGPNGLHFQCAFFPVYPQSILGFKTPPNNDCRDGFNLNMLFLVMNSIIRWEELHLARL